LGIHPYEAVNDHETRTLSAFEAASPMPPPIASGTTEIGAYYCTPTENLADGSSEQQLEQLQSASAATWSTR